MSRLAIVAAALVVLATTGCKKNTPLECRAFVETVEKLESCSKLPESTRKLIKGQADTMKRAMDQLDDAGGDIPDSQRREMERMCKKQGDTIREAYKKVAPDCLD